MPIVTKPLFRHFEQDATRPGLSLDQDNVICIIYPHGYTAQVYILEQFGDHLFHVYDYRNYLTIGRMILEVYGSYNISVSGAVVVALHSIATISTLSCYIKKDLMKD